MGIFDFFKKMQFFGDKDISDLRQEDVDFELWRNAHRAWRNRLVEAIQTGSFEWDTASVSCDDRCDLGQWIYSRGVKFYAELPEFQRLREDHAAFHRAAAEVLRLVQQGNTDEAKKMLCDEFDRLSITVIGHLNVLEKIVQG